jgi:hypothetical protein
VLSMLCARPGVSMRSPGASTQLVTWSRTTLPASILVLPPRSLPARNLGFRYSLGTRGSGKPTALTQGQYG